MWWLHWHYRLTLSLRCDQNEYKNLNTAEFILSHSFYLVITVQLRNLSVGDPQAHSPQVVTSVNHFWLLLCYPVCYDFAFPQEWSTLPKNRIKKKFTLYFREWLYLINILYSKTANLPKLNPVLTRLYK